MNIVELIKQKKIPAAIGTVILVGCMLVAPDLVSKEDLQTVLTDSKSQVEQTVVSQEKDKKQNQPVQDTETLCFRNQKLLNQHYEKHGKDMGFANATEYEMAAAKVVSNPNALHKTEAEDGDDIYYLESSNEFVVVSTDGYLRTYFWPDSGIKYYNKQ